MKNGFLAKPVVFEKLAGYMVEQYHEGKKVVSQFVTQESYKTFCEAIGTVPAMEGETHG